MENSHPSEETGSHMTQTVTSTREETIRMERGARRQAPLLARGVRKGLAEKPTSQPHTVGRASWEGQRLSGWDMLGTPEGLKVGQVAGPAGSAGVWSRLHKELRTPSCRARGLLCQKEGDG